MFIVHWFLTPPSLISLHFTFSRYLAFLAADWSGLSVPIRSPSPLCPPVPVDDVAVFSLWFLSSLSFLVLSPFSLVFGGLCPFPSSRLSASPLLSLLVFRLFPLTPLVLTGPGFLGSRSPSFPPSAVAFFVLLVCALLPLLSPLGVVPGLSGRRLVRISSATLFLLLPPFLTSLFPYFVSRWDLSFSVIFLAADWSGVSHCWLSCPCFPPLNQARSLAADWSGALLLILYHGTPHKTTSRAGMG